MAKHYIRDARIAMGVNSYEMGQQKARHILYHFLRVAGCEWLWECDGARGPCSENANHVYDGDMGESGTGYWASEGGGTFSKDSTTKFTGTQSLEVVSSSGGASGVKSSALISMQNPQTLTIGTSDSILSVGNGKLKIHDAASGIYKTFHGGRVILSGCSIPGNNGTFPIVGSEHVAVSDTDVYIYNPSGSTEYPTAATGIFQAKYELSIWALNDSGVSWDVQVDPGTGSPASVGSIPSDGVWTRYHFTFYRTGTGSNYIYVLSATSGKTIYINGIHVFRSAYEYFNENKYGTGGTVAAPDLFTPGGMTPTGDDTGKWLFIWDTGVPSNSGAYKITGLSGGAYQVDLRSGSMVFDPVGSSVVRWRIVDVELTALPSASIQVQDCWLCGIGFGLESPHSSHWRLFMRDTIQDGYSARARPAILWASPEDTDFNISSGTFYKTGPSTQRSRTGPYLWEGGELYYWSGGKAYTSVDRSSRYFVMTDDDVSFVTHYQWSVTRVVGDAVGFVGFTGTDPNYPDEEEFALLFGKPDSMSGSPDSEMAFTGADGTFLSDGSGFTPEGLAIRTIGAVFGYGQAALSVITQANACPSPWSGEEHIDPLFIVRDPDTLGGAPGERELTNGLFMARQNLPQLATFDSGNYLHFTSGLVWEWNGATLA